MFLYKVSHAVRPAGSMVCFSQHYQCWHISHITVQRNDKMVNPTAVFLPLYLYPYNSSWDSVAKSIALHPDVSFQIVVAPNLVNVVPDINYVAHLRMLNNYTNVQTLGYVSTTWATRNITTVQEEIKSYASWTNYTTADIRVSGIFFDETPSANTTENISYMSGVTTFAKAALAPSRNKVVYNPGVNVDESWFKLADEIIIYENTWAAFNSTQLNMIPERLQSKSVYLIHNFTGDSDLQDDLVSNLTDHDLAGVFVTTRDGYTSISALWDDFCEALDQSISDDNDDNENEDDDDGETGDEDEDDEDNEDGDDEDDEEADCENDERDK
jgi:hypothetical protein